MADQEGSVPLSHGARYRDKGWIDPFWLRHLETGWPTGISYPAGDKSLRNLGVGQMDLWQLHRIDPKVPADEQFDAIKSLIDEKLVRHAGLSEVSVVDIKEASKFFNVATVQNRYNLVDRRARKSSSIVLRTTSGSFRGSRSLPVISPGPVRYLIPSPENTAPCRVRSRWPGD